MNIDRLFVFDIQQAPQSVMFFGLRGLIFWSGAVMHEAHYPETGHWLEGIEKLGCSFFFSKSGFVGDFRADESIEEEVSGAEHNNPERVDIAGHVGNETLDEHHYGATEHHGHEDTGGDSGVFAETFNCHVEDGAPHNWGAETNEKEWEDA